MLILIFQWDFIISWVSIFLCFLHTYLITFFFVPLFCLFVCFCCTCVLGEFCSFDVVVVVSYLCCYLPICFVLLCALCFVLCFSLHLQNQFLSITLVPILIIPFLSLSLSLSLSLLLFLFFFFFRSLFFYVSFCGKILAKFCFAKFDRNPKRKGKKTKTKQNEEVQEKEYVCCFLLMLFFLGGDFFSKNKWVLLHFSCFTKFLAQNCHP